VTIATIVETAREITTNDIRWKPFSEPVNWFEGVDPDDGLAGMVARLLLMRRADAEVVSVALERLHEEQVEIKRQQRTIVRLHEERRQAMDNKQALKGGVIINDVDALRVVLTLIEAGAEFTVDGSNRLWVSPPPSRDSYWGRQILKHRDDIIRIIGYRCPEPELPR
jgi:hypothetical protein